MGWITKGLSIRSFLFEYSYGNRTPYCAHIVYLQKVTLTDCCLAWPGGRGGTYLRYNFETLDRRRGRGKSHPQPTPSCFSSIREGNLFDRIIHTCSTAIECEIVNPPVAFDLFFFGTGSNDGKPQRALIRPAISDWEIREIRHFADHGREVRYSNQTQPNSKNARCTIVFVVTCIPGRIFGF